MKFPLFYGKRFLKKWPNTNNDKPLSTLLLLVKQYCLEIYLNSLNQTNSEMTFCERSKKCRELCRRHAKRLLECYL